MLKPASNEFPTPNPVAVGDIVQYHSNNEYRGGEYKGPLARIAIAAGHLLSGDIKAKGTYREIFNPVTATREYRARTSWIDQLL